jgi:hypothetical protein
MEEAIRTYAHVLLFQCPRCLKPVAVAEEAAQRNLEEIDASAIKTGCACGWSGTLLGVHARQHWVEAWDRPVREEDAGEVGDPEKGLTLS